jgi:dolichol-phosphate mannosyltransferase
MTGAMLPIAVVIPCFRVRRHIASVLAGLAGRVARVIVVDDACPESTGRFVADSVRDPAIRVVWHAENQGVGGAVLTGYAAALQEGWPVVVKMDGDGQMDPAYLAALVAPVLAGHADYAKGNRFFGWRSWRGMPAGRLVGNLTVSMLMKALSGYPGLMDPTNGYTAIAAPMLRRLPLDRLERRWFFECDMLFHLSALRATVRDVPIPALYGEEVSGMGTAVVLRSFPGRLVLRAMERMRG